MRSGGRLMTALQDTALRRSEPEPVPAIEDVGGGLWAVTIDGKVHRLSERFWTGLANAILDKAHAGEIAREKAA